MYPETLHGRIRAIERRGRWRRGSYYVRMAPQEYAHLHYTIAPDTPPFDPDPDGYVAQFLGVSILVSEDLGPGQVLFVPYGIDDSLLTAIEQLGVKHG